jgi:hypothetical protein
MKPGSKRQDTTANPTAPGETLLLLIEVMLFGMQMKRDRRWMSLASFGGWAGR